MRIAALQSPTEMVTLAHVGQSEWLLRQLGLNPLEQHSATVVSHMETLLGSVLCDSVSGLVADPRYGFELSTLGKNEHKRAVGIAWRLVGEPEPLSLPQLIKGWGVEEVANAYGVAYLELQYHPSEAQAVAKKQFVFELSDYCKNEGIDLVLDLDIVSSDGNKIHPDELAEVQLTAVQELREGPAAFALEYPGNALAAATITSELDVPWLLVARESEYQLVKTHLRDVLGSGAKGFVAGFQLYPELAGARNPDMSVDWDEVTRLVKTVVRDRFAELSRIVAEAD